MFSVAFRSKGKNTIIINILRYYGCFNTCYISVGGNWHRYKGGQSVRGFTFSD